MFLDKRLLKWVKDLRIKFILPISAEVLLAFFIIIEAVYLSVITEKVFLQNRSLEDIFPELAGFFLISILRVLTSWQEQKRLSNTGSVLKTRLQSRLINRIHESGPSGLPENSAAEFFGHDLATTQICQTRVKYSYHQEHRARETRFGKGCKTIG